MRFLDYKRRIPILYRSILWLSPKSRVAEICLPVSLLCLGIQPLEAAVKPKLIKNDQASDKGFQYSVTSLRSSFNIPLTIKERVIAISSSQIKSRLENSSKDPRVEPIQLTVEGKDDKILDLASKISKPDMKLELANYLKTNFVHGEPIPGTDLRLVTVDSTAFKLIQEESFEQLFAKKHTDISINAKSLRHDNNTKQEFINQLKPFLANTEIENIRKKIAAGIALNVDKDLLPAFARQRVAKHTIFKGPNCFHAALSFQSPLLASSSSVNVSKESGYHRDMINYDELWRVLQMSFYEVDPQTTELQYGDMIVFFEAKEQAASSPIDYRSLRHATTYLLGGYVFAKGSKSANSPYLVRTLADEWDTWSKYTEKLGAKVFRRSLNSVTSAQPVDPVDWVY